MHDHCPIFIPGLKIGPVIGHGGMSTVWKAQDTLHHRVVAVKVMDPELLTHQDDIHRFFTEAHTMARLNHPGLIHGYVCDQQDNHYYVVMEYIDGYSISMLLNRKRKLPEADGLIIAESIACALEYAWNQCRLVHCDIKPENIMVCRDGNVKLGDFGVCQTEALDVSKTSNEEFFATPAYISPERISGTLLCDCRADIYSLGATLYHLVTGQTLFSRNQSVEEILQAHMDPEQQAPDPRMAAPLLSEGFVQLLEHMLVKDRDQRYASWTEVLVDVRQLETTLRLPPMPATAISSMERSW